MGGKKHKSGWYRRPLPKKKRSVLFVGNGLVCGLGLVTWGITQTFFFGYDSSIIILAAACYALTSLKHYCPVYHLLFQTKWFLLWGISPKTSHKLVQSCSYRESLCSIHKCCYRKSERKSNLFLSPRTLLIADLPLMIWIWLRVGFYYPVAGLVFAIVPSGEG